MNRFETALKRFSAALDKLEASAASRMVAAQDNGADPDVSALRHRVAVLEEESRNSSGLAEEIEVRLDGAIAEIRSVLDRS